MAFQHLFAINGTWLFPPDNYAETNIPVIGYNLFGSPIRQGYPEFVFTWTFMLQEHLTALMAIFDPTAPNVTVSYLNKSTGNIITQYAFMEEPIVGSRAIIYYNNVAVKFTRIRDVE